MLDLTDARLRRALGLTLKELVVEDWRKLQDAGKESFAQAFGRAVAEIGGSGLLARLAAVRRGVNMVIFPEVCRADRLAVVEGEKLEKLGMKAKV
jgi:hypothetical protein